MTPLSERELRVLEEVVDSAAENKKVVASCLYGSKAAGYARADSDYDVIVVVSRFREGVRYRYQDSPVASSALIVDEEILEKDARNSFLGEFVVGRFLNVYEPLRNPEFLRSIEVEYKRRVAVEALLSITSDYGEFSAHLKVPYEYFLFDKLKKRSAVYPPALYSYTQTYGGPNAASNIASSVNGFKEACLDLEKKNLVQAGEDFVRLQPDRLKGDSFTKVQSLFSLTTRSVTQYAVHGYAGRVGFRVFRKEAQSKLRRMRENILPPLQLSRPETLLKLEFGELISDATKMEKDLARILGFVSYTTWDKEIGEPYSTTRVVTFAEGDRQESAVVKSYSDVRSLKWAFLGVWAVATRRFNMSPLARLEREYEMTRRLKEQGVAVPSILAVAPGERIMAKEFVKGPNLARVIDDVFKGDGSKVGHVSDYGSLLARVHGLGIAVGDSKASNVVLSDGGPVLTDLEQAAAGGDQSWDIAEFLFYTSKLSTREEAMASISETFLSAYARLGKRAVLAKAGGTKYFRPFQPFVMPGMAKMIRDELASYS